MWYILCYMIRTWNIKTAMLYNKSNYSVTNGKSLQSSVKYRLKQRSTYIYPYARNQFEHICFFLILKPFEFYDIYIYIACDIAVIDVYQTFYTIVV